MKHHGNVTKINGAEVEPYQNTAQTREKSALTSILTIGTF